MKLSTAIDDFWMMDEMRFRAFDDKLSALKEVKLNMNSVSAANDYMTTDDGVAILSITGVVVKEADLMSQLLGGVTSLSEVRNNFLTALDDPSVTSIYLYMDSPGGTFSGTADMAEAISNSTKPVTVFVSDTCCSAAYFIASQADRIISNEAGQIGSIGVITAVVDMSKAAEKAGVKVTTIRSSPLKGASAGDEVSNELIADRQRQVDSIYQMFIQKVMAGREMTDEQMEVVSTGQVWIASEALKLGLIDAIATPEEAFEQRIKGKANMNMKLKSNEAVKAAADAKIEAAVEPVIEAKSEVIEAIATNETEAAVEQPVVEMISIEKGKFEAAIAASLASESKVIASFEAGKVAGIEAEKVRFNALAEMCKSDSGFAIEQYIKGNDKAQAAIEYVAHLQAVGGSQSAGLNAPVRLRKDNKQETKQLIQLPADFN